MRLLTKLDNYLEIHSLFHDAIENKEAIVSWQKSDQQRSISITTLADFDDASDQLTFSLQKDSGFKEDEVYFFFKDQSVIFKSNIEKLEKDNFLVDFPRELKDLDEADSQSLNISAYLDNPVFFVPGSGRANDPGHMSVDSKADKVSTKWSMKSMSSKDSDLFAEELSFVTLDEEDKMYADKREAPRARPPEGKTVGIAKSGAEGEVLDFPLFDLSQGGLGFIITDKSAFSIGEVILVIQFDDKVFDQPMQVEIKAIRETDENATSFKVGCAFSS